MSRFYFRACMFQIEPGEDVSFSQEKLLQLPLPDAARKKIPIAPRSTVPISLKA